jgi:hypothetical protein
MIIAAKEIRYYSRDRRNPAVAVAQSQTTNTHTVSDRAHCTTYSQEDLGGLRQHGAGQRCRSRKAIAVS